MRRLGFEGKLSRANKKVDQLLKCLAKYFKLAKHEVDRLKSNMRMKAKSAKIAANEFILCQLKDAKEKFNSKHELLAAFE